MRVSHTTTHHINTGPYEFREDTITVEISDEDYPGKTPDELLDIAEEMITDHFRPILRKISQYASDDSYVHLMKGDR